MREGRSPFCMAGFQSNPPRPVRDDQAAVASAYQKRWRWWKVTDNNASRYQNANATRVLKPGASVQICTNVRVLPHNGGSLITGYRNITSDFAPAFLVQTPGSASPDAAGGTCAVWEKELDCPGWSGP